MADNIRVYELAKELNKTNKEVLDVLENKMGVKGKSHSSVITDEQAKKIKELILEPAQEVKKKPKAFIVKKAKPAPAPETQEPKKEEPKPVIPQQKVIEKVNLSPAAAVKKAPVQPQRPVQPAKPQKTAETARLDRKKDVKPESASKTQPAKTEKPQKTSGDSAAERKPIQRHIISPDI